MHLSPRASDITDVTLASNHIPVCKHFQTGYCKFGRSCKKQHISESCLKADCNSKACLQRHPKQCKFFSQSGFCKFGESTLLLPALATSAYKSRPWKLELETCAKL